LHKKYLLCMKSLPRIKDGSGSSFPFRPQTLEDSRLVDDDDVDDDDDDDDDVDVFVDVVVVVVLFLFSFYH
jgi:hypothetical protein